MRIPAPTMTRSDGTPGPVGGAPKGSTDARGGSADALLDNSPPRFNRIHLVRVWRQELNTGAARLDEVAHGPRFVRRKIIEHHDVAPPQLGRQPSSHPVGECVGVHRTPTRAQGHPAVEAHRANHRQVVAPVHRARLHQDRAARQPRVRPAHRQMRAGFVYEDKLARSYRFRPPPEASALGPNIRPLLLRGSRSFFLQTYPPRRRARRTLDRWTRPSGATARLYARVSSSVVISGRSRFSRCSNGITMGETQPPRFLSAATDPVSRARCTHRIKVARCSWKRSATSVYDSSPPSYALTARSRRSRAYGFGMRVGDHRISRNSSEYWG